MTITRRQLIANSIGIASALGTSKLFATPEEVAAAMDVIAGDTEIVIGGITLKLPEIAENGNIVPVSVSVESPMTPDSHVETVTIFAEENPHATIVTFNLTPSNGEAFVSTRMRLATTQNVISVARMSDGSVISDTKHVKVTIGGCGG